jgi:hypothetical protein
LVEHVGGDFDFDGVLDVDAGVVAFLEAGPGHRGSSQSTVQVDEVEGRPMGLEVLSARFELHAVEHSVSDAQLAVVVPVYVNREAETWVSAADDFDVAGEVANPGPCVEVAVFVGDGLGGGSVVGVFERRVDGDSAVGVETGDGDYFVFVGVAEGGRE